MINVIGNILGTSGYAIHTRSLVNALSKITDTRLETAVPKGAEMELSSKELELMKVPYPKDFINLAVVHPLQWKQTLTQERNWVYLIWEGDFIPEWILRECSNPKIEKIIVASEHTKQAYLNSLKEDRLKLYGEFIHLYKNAKDKIVVIPHGVDLDKFYPKQMPKDKFTFLGNKGFRNLEDRGGMQYLIKAYLEEFTPEDNTNLIIKVNPAYGVNDLQNLIQQLLPDKPLPLFQINTDPLNNERLNEMYNMADVFVSPTRAEAFNIPCIEAMACGKPVITTNFGGQTDFCTDETGWIIGGELTEVQHELEYEGVKWLTPDIESLKGCMRFAYENRKITERFGKSAKETAKDMTWDHTAKKVKDLI